MHTSKILNRLLGLKDITRKPKIERAPHAPKPFGWKRSAANDKRRQNVLPRLRRFMGSNVSGWINNSNQVTSQETVYDIIYDDKGKSKKVKRT